eukprot:2251173-Alexandrium_andersonii.AAC.1
MCIRDSSKHALDLVTGQACTAARPVLASTTMASAVALRANRSHYATAHINGHVGHPWNELADSLATLLTERAIKGPNIEQLAQASGIRLQGRAAQIQTDMAQ